MAANHRWRRKPTEQEVELAFLRRWATAPHPLEWGGMIIRPSDRLYGKQDMGEVYDVPGVYMFFDEGRMTYIGRSLNMHQRIWLRIRRTNGNITFRFREMDEICIKAVEIAHIYALRPRNNVKYEPRNWIGHAEMVGAIQELWNQR